MVFAEQLWKGTRTNMSEVRRWGSAAMHPGLAEPAAVCQGMRGRAVPSSSSAAHQRVAIVISNSRTCIRGIGSCRDDGLEASATSDTVVGRRQGFESEPSALPSEACSSVGQSLSVASISVGDSLFPNPESSAVTAFLHSRNESVVSNRSRSPADQPSEEFASKTK